jgi:hypothetical protein
MPTNGAAAVQISAVLSGFDEVQSTFKELAQAATTASQAAAKAAEAASKSVELAQKKLQEGAQKTSSAFGGLRQSVSSFAATASGTAALLSIFARNNEQLQRSLEVVSIGMAAAGTAVRVLAAAMRFALTPIGLVVTAIGAAIAIAMNWEVVSQTVTRAVQQVWTGLGTFFTRLFGGIGESARGLGQILLGALTFDPERISAGVSQLMAGFADLKAVGVDTWQSVSTATVQAATATKDFLTSLVAVKEEIKAVGLTPQELGLAQLGEAWGNLEKDIVAGQKAADDFVTAADEGIKVLEADLEALGESFGTNLEKDIALGQQAADTFVAEGLSPILAGLAAMEQSEFGGAAEAQLRLGETAARTFTEKLERIPEAFRSIAEASAATTEQLEAGWQTFSSFFQTTMITWADISRATWATFVSGVGSAVSQAILQGKNLATAMQNVLTSVADVVIQMAVKLAAQWVMTHITMAAAAKAWAFVEVAAAAVVAGAMAWLASIKQLGWVGIIIGAAIAAAVIAGILALTGNLHSGMTEVPATGTFLLKQGERVLSPPQNQDLMEFIDAGGRGGGDLHVHLQFSPLTIVDDVTMDQAARQIGRELNKQGWRNWTRR